MHRRANGSIARPRVGPAYPILTLALMLFLLPVGLSVPAAVELSFEPDWIQTIYPETFVVSLQAEDLDGLRGYELEVQFDAAAIDFVSAQRGELFADYSPPQGLYWSIDDQGGRVGIECFIIPLDECVEGSGEILRLRFAALDAHAETDIEITAAELRDCDGLPITPVETAPAHVVVGAVTELFCDPDPKYVLGYLYPCDLSVAVDSIASLRGFQIHLEYDFTKLRFDSAGPGELMTPDPPVPLWWYVIEESPSRVRIEGVLLGPDESVDGPGDLIDLHFTSFVHNDSTELVFQEWHLWDVASDELYPITTDDGLIIVDEALQAVDPQAPADSGVDRLELACIGSNPGLEARYRCRLGDARRLRWEVCDVAGRVLWRNGPLAVAGGEALIHWEGRAATGARAPAGVYFLRARAGRETARHRFVLVR